MSEDAKKRKKMPSAPIKAPASNVGGRMGLFTGGEVPTVVAAPYGGGNPMRLFMRGYDVFGFGRRQK